MKKKGKSASVGVYVKPTMHVVEMRMTGAVLTASGDTDANNYERMTDETWDEPAS